MRTVHCHILVRDPAVIVGFGGPIGPAGILGAHLAGLPVWFLVNPWWSIEDEAVLSSILASYPAYKKAHPEHEIVYLCNTDLEVALLRERGIPAVFCHQNAFIDERLFAPDLAAPKVFDAVYNARLAPFKRHHLAAEIRALALIYYCLGETERQVYELLTRLLSDAAFLNGPPNRLSWFSPEKTAAYYNRARAGLCLSEGEGAMYASAEYLLCGLPVVTTPNIGGRDYFLDAPHCAVAEPDPESVAEATAFLGGRDFDPLAIRKAALDKMLPQRELLIELVQSICDASDKNIDFRQLWPDVFINKLHIPNRDPARVAGEILAGRAPYPAGLTPGCDSVAALSHC